MASCIGTGTQTKWNSARCRVHAAVTPRTTGTWTETAELAIENLHVRDVITTARRTTCSVRCRRSKSGTVRRVGKGLPKHSESVSSCAAAFIARRLGTLYAHPYTRRKSCYYTFPPNLVERLGVWTSDASTSTIRCVSTFDRHQHDFHGIECQQSSLLSPAASPRSSAFEEEEQASPACGP